MVLVVMEAVFVDGVHAVKTMPTKSVMVLAATIFQVVHFFHNLCCSGVGYPNEVLQWYN